MFLLWDCSSHFNKELDYFLSSTWTLLASLRSCSRAAASMNMSPGSVLIKRMPLSYLQSAPTQDTAAEHVWHMLSETEGWMWSHAGSRSAPKQRLLWQQGCHNTVKLCGAEAVGGGPEGVGRHICPVPVEAAGCRGSFLRLDHLNVGSQLFPIVL